MVRTWWWHLVQEDQVLTWKMTFVAAKPAASYAPLSSPGLAGSYLDGVSTLAQPGPVTHRCVPFLIFDKRVMHLFHPPADIQHIRVLSNWEHLNFNDTAK